MALKDTLKKLENSIKQIELLPTQSAVLRKENERIKKFANSMSKRIKDIKKKARGGKIK